MLLQMIEFTPDVFFPSPAFPIGFRVAMAALTLVHSDIVFAALDLLRTIFSHECLDPNSRPPPPKFPIYAAAIRPVVEREGQELTALLLAGLVGDFPEESIPMVATIFRVLGGLWPTQLLTWLPPIVQQLPPTVAPDQAKSVFITDINRQVPAFLYRRSFWALTSGGSTVQFSRRTSRKSNTRSGICTGRHERRESADALVLWTAEGVCTHRVVKKSVYVPSPVPPHITSVPSPPRRR